MVKKSVKRFALGALSAAFALSLPAMASATEPVQADVKAKILGELNILNLVKVGGKCDKIYVKIRTKELQGVDWNKINASVKYDIYFDRKLDGLKGKIVGNGEINASQQGDYFEISYDPTANPEGPAGNYALKVYLTLGKDKHKLPLVVRVKINEPCTSPDNNGGANNGGSNNGGTDNGGTDNGGADNGGTNNGGANNGGTNNGGANNGGANNGGANNGGANNGGATNGGASNGGVANGGAANGGKLPKTANNFATSAAVGAGLALTGAAVLVTRRRASN